MTNCTTLSFSPLLTSAVALCFNPATNRTQVDRIGRFYLRSDRGFVWARIKWNFRGDVPRCLVFLSVLPHRSQNLSIVGLLFCSDPKLRYLLVLSTGLTSSSLAGCDRLPLKDVNRSAVCDVVRIENSPQSPDGVIKSPPNKPQASITTVMV